ncbi:MAG: hypothetical protein DCO96_00315 [Fluviicola sp. XM-24bin1]|nr:MAG: hypothetical protein DCO96_00315 [Fluviicola sp. XM-24bin1]
MKWIISLWLIVLSTSFSTAQDALEPDEQFEPEIETSQDGAWLGIPVMNADGIALMDQDGFFILMGAAGLSYLLSEFVFKDTNLNYYQTRFGTYGVSDRTTITFQTFGIEKRVSPWFGIGIEGNFQQWKSRSPSNYTGAGLGINTYYRWHILGKRKFSPYLEYGAGIFHGFKPLPYNGSNFTFHLTTSIGAEYTFNNRNKLRLSYGHLHQSNNGLLEVNPGLDGAGFQVSFLWFWDESKW